MAVVRKSDQTRTVDDYRSGQVEARRATPRSGARPKLYGYGATPVTWQGCGNHARFDAAHMTSIWIFIGFDRAVTTDDVGSIIALLATGLVLVAARLDRQPSDDRRRYGAGGGEARNSRDREE